MFTMDDYSFKSFKYNNGCAKGSLVADFKWLWPCVSSRKSPSIVLEMYLQPTEWLHFHQIVDRTAEISAWKTTRDWNMFGPSEWSAPFASNARDLNSTCDWKVTCISNEFHWLWILSLESGSRTNMSEVGVWSNELYNWWDFSMSD